MNCFRMKTWWTLKETHNPSNIALENWNLELWEKIIVLKWVIVSLKVNVFRNLELQWSVPVSDKCLWLVFSELFEERRHKLLKRLILGGRELRLLSKKRISVEKTIREKEIVKATQVRMSMACLYLLGKCGCSCGRQFPKFQFDLQRKQSSLSLLIDMFGKAEMRVKRWLFWKAGEDFKMRVTPVWCGWVGIIVFLSPQKSSVFPWFSMKLAMIQY